MLLRANVREVITINESTTSNDETPEKLAMEALIAMSKDKTNIFVEEEEVGF